MVANISAGSTNCGASDPYGERTSTFDLQAPPGKDDFVARTYDKPPSGGSIPNGANQLGYGVATQTIAAGNPANVPLSLSGVLARIQLDVTPNSLHTIAPSTATVNVYGLDADNDLIVTDAYVDGSSNPITVKFSLNNTLPLIDSASSSSQPSLTLTPSSNGVGNVVRVVP